MAFMMQKYSNDKIDCLRLDRRRPFIGRRHCTMAAPTFSMAAAIPEIRDLVRYKQFLKVNIAASSSDEQSSHQNTFAS